MNRLSARPAGSPETRPNGRREEGKRRPALPPALAAAARYDLALAYRAVGRSAEADAILANLAKAQAGPITADAQFLVGQSHLDAGRYAEAVAPLEGYLAANPRGDVAEFAMAHLVMARLALGQSDAAWKMLARLAQDVSRKQEPAAGTAASRRGSSQGSPGRASRGAVQARRGQCETRARRGSVAGRQTGRRDHAERFRYEPTADWDALWPSLASRLKPHPPFGEATRAGT